MVFNDSGLSYVQGMNLVAAIFLHHTAEELAFWLMHKFILELDMQDVFSKSQ